MFYCEIDKNGFCFHVTETELPLSDTVILSETNEVGKMYINGEWVEVPQEEPDTPQPTQLDRIESMVAKSNEEIAQEARDAYTLELIEGGIIA